MTNWIPRIGTLHRVAAKDICAVDLISVAVVVVCMVLALDALVTLERRIALFQQPGAFP